MRSWTILLGVIAVLALGLSAVAEEPAVVPSVEAGDLESDLGLDLGSEEPLAPGAGAEAASEAVPAAADEVTPAAGEGAAAEAAVAPESASTPSPQLEDSARTSIELESELSIDAEDETAAALDEGIADLGSAASVPAVASSDTSAGSSQHAIAMGPEGLDTQGRRGRIHTVARRDTLWDISEAYLGTPWVWPSIWEDNRAIDNPHLINPGDRIWISSTLMRPISEEEAAEFLAASAAADSEIPAAAEDAPVDEMALEDSEEPAEADEPMDQLSMGVPGEEKAPDSQETLKISWRDRLGVVAENPHDVSVAVVGGPSPRSQFAQGDDIYFELPDEGVSVGDQFSIFRDAVRIRDPATHRFIGYYIEALGWGEVIMVSDDVATLRVHRSITEMEVGDRVISRRVLGDELALKPAPAGLEAQVAYIPNSREVVALFDYVYLNRGSLHGLQEGMKLEVYLPGGQGHAASHTVKNRLPDRVLADLVVANVTPGAAVAVVISANTEVEIGAHVRPESQDLAAR